jgi:glutamate racemase
VAAVIDSDRVGVLATPATASSGAYRRALHAVRPTARVTEVACPAFVPLIEAGDLACAELRSVAETYVQPLLQAEVDTVVMGCTHYPLLRPLLKQLLPAGTRLVDPALAAVERLGPLLASLGDSPEAEQPLNPAEAAAVPARVCVTGCATSFAAAAQRWLGHRPEVSWVDLRSAG